MKSLVFDTWPGLTDVCIGCSIKYSQYRQFTVSWDAGCLYANPYKNQMLTSEASKLLGLLCSGVKKHSRQIREFGSTEAFEAAKKELVAKRYAKVGRGKGGPLILLKKL